MAIVHNMGHRGRRAQAAFCSAKSVIGNALWLIGCLFSGVTIISLVFFISNFVLSGFDFMKSDLIQKMCYWAKWWINYLCHYIVQVEDFVDKRISASVPSTKWRDLPVELGLLALGPISMIIVFKLGSILRLIGKTIITTGSGKEAGFYGEEEALKLFKKLPDDVHVFVNLEFEKRGHHETDFIIVAPAGVTVCEVKNWSGRVVYDEEDEHTVIRISKRGDVSNMHSPVHQVIAHYETLRDALRDQGINANPRGLVIMMHPDVSLEDFQYCNVPVLKQPSLNTVEGYLGNAHLTKIQIDRTVQALKKIAS